MGYKENLGNVAALLPTKNGRVLITGATGLIGSCCVDVLLTANTRFDAEFEIYTLGRSRDRLANRFGENVIPVVQDIMQPLNDYVEYDYIIHAASNADPRMYAVQPVETVLTNIIGTKNVLDYCKKHGQTRMLFTSTFEVYGKIAGVDVYREDMAGAVDFQRLRNGYTESKRCAEILVKSYVDQYGVNAVIGRLASIYGPTMLKNDSKAHAQFIRNALNSEDIVLKSEGKPKRTYCYVLDAVSGIFTILFKGEMGGAYNIANENSVASIAEVAACCAAIAGTKVVFDVPDQVEAKGFSTPQNCILDNTKLKGLGWTGM